MGNTDKTQGPRRERMNDGEQLEIRAAVTLQVLEKDLSNCSKVASTSPMIHDTSVNAMHIYQRIAGSQYPSIIFCWKFYLCLHSIKLYFVPQKTTKGFFLSLSMEMLPWAYVQSHPEGILHLWPHVETAWKLTPGRECKNIQENKRTSLFARNWIVCYQSGQFGIVPSNPILCFLSFFLFLMCSVNTLSPLNNHSNLPPSHQRQELTKSPRGTEAGPGSPRVPRMENEKPQFTINQIRSYKGCYQMYYPSLGSYFHIFTLLPIRALYTPVHERVTHAASLEAKPTSQS